LRITPLQIAALSRLTRAAPTSVQDRTDGRSVSHQQSKNRSHRRSNQTSGRSSGSSPAAARSVGLDQPPSIDNGEITDKGYINQRAVLKRRDTLVQALHAGGPDVILAR
jgi:feruloyl-CoA synthase